MQNIDPPDSTTQETDPVPIHPIDPIIQMDDTGAPPTSPNFSVTLKNTATVSAVQAACSAAYVNPKDTTLPITQIADKFTFNVVDTDGQGLTFNITVVPSSKPIKKALMFMVWLPNTDTTKPAQVGLAYGRVK